MRVHVVARIGTEDLESAHFDFVEDEAPSDLTNKVLGLAVSAAVRRPGRSVEILLQVGTDPRLTAWTGSAVSDSGGVTISNTDRLSSATAGLYEEAERAAAIA